MPARDGSLVRHGGCVRSEAAALLVGLVSAEDSSSSPRLSAATPSSLTSGCAALRDLFDGPVTTEDSCTLGDRVQSVILLVMHTNMLMFGSAAPIRRWRMDACIVQRSLYGDFFDVS